MLKIFHRLSILVGLGSLVAFTASPPPAHAERIKDMAQVQGVRTNQLVGYGLVVGLDGTGDQTSQAPFTIQSLTNMLAQLGVTVPTNVTPQLKNVAAVSVHAEMPAFVKPGQTIDITVNSIANAKSLRGGSLLVTPLHGLDGQIYAIAQGNLIVSGFGVQGNDGSKLTVNVPSSGRIPNGATIEKAVPTQLAQGDAIVLNLNDPDFTTATRLVQVVNRGIGEDIATIVDGGSVRVRAPLDITQRVAFLSTVENLEIDPGSGAAKVIINSRTGTVVISSNVRVSPAAVSHGSLTVSIKEEQKVSQPSAFSSVGTTTVTTSSTINVDQGSNRMFLFKPGVELEQIVHAVNEVGAAPGDLVAILEALKEAGALQAELIVI
ncbi:MAG TPA: flagellar basal body P-ring protein FlgI [Steroidobacteraceae bacterium]|jgi:flagellar P-ring protein FlgI|nr:flagellar basal body P-ring protein FlgI [Steroidobacteraceae bacterium]